MTSGPLSSTGSEPLTFTCPRCDVQVSATYYGPCSTCRESLAASHGGVARDVEVEAYEPKVNVVPNAVALKE